MRERSAGETKLTIMPMQPISANENRRLEICAM